MTEKQQILEILKNLYDPDYLDRSIVDMGLVGENDINIGNDKIEINYTLTAPMCPFSSAIGVMIKHILERKLSKPVEVRIKADHFQAQAVNEILENEDKRRELLEKLKSFGILEKCIKSE